MLKKIVEQPVSCGKAVGTGVRRLEARQPAQSAILALEAAA
jgi:hypothetical protein